LLYTQGKGAISHTTALAIWRLREAHPEQWIHVTVPAGIRQRATGGLRVHQQSGLKRYRVPVRADGRGYVLDLYAQREKVNFELDGAAFHGSQAQRENDLRRDAALAMLGILVVRFSFTRLTGEPETVRQEALTILRARQR
jgi:very-short-patch-repair endonuclease